MSYGYCFGYTEWIDCKISCCISVYHFTVTCVDKPFESLSRIDSRHDKTHLLCAYIDCTYIHTLIFCRLLFLTVYLL